MNSYPTESWLSQSENLEYSDYWNDEMQEMEKVWWVLDGDFSRMENHLTDIHAVSQLESCVLAAQRFFARSICGIGVDLAAGNLWATRHLLRRGAQKVISVEYSRHRLLKLGNAVLEHYGISPEHVMLVLGDIHHLHLPDSSLDYVFMSQAFHHSETPNRLLIEIQRVIKPQGLVIIIGEHILSPTLFTYLLQPLKFVVSRLISVGTQQKMFGHTIQGTDLWFGQSDFVGKDDILGDHYYTDSQYKRLFYRHAFEYVCLRQTDWESQAFVLIPKRGPSK